MLIEKSTYDQIDQILTIIESAKTFFKSKGIDQWQDGYPNRAVIAEDIDKGYSYILKNPDNIIIGTASISFDGEPSYNYIEGAWKYEGNYTVLHRLAIDPREKGRGLAVSFLEFAHQLSLENQIYLMRVDTHRENLAMQRVLEKLGYSYSGIIYLESGDERLAYEKKLSYT